MLKLIVSLVLVGVPAYFALDAFFDVSKRVSEWFSLCKAHLVEWGHDVRVGWGLAQVPASPTPPANIPVIEPQALPIAPTTPRFNFASVPWRLVLIVAVLLLVVFGIGQIKNLFGWGKSGAEVTAELNTRTAEANQRTSDASLDQQKQATRRVENLQARLNRLNREAEAARNALKSAPDYDARYAAYRAHSDSMRNQSDAARAAAVSDLGSGVGH